MKIKKILIPIGVITLMCVSGQALALKSISRACRFADIPYGLENLSVRFFYAVGADKSVLTLPAASQNEKEKWWILESLTTDYGSSRYYLFASAGVYVQRTVDSSKPYLLTDTYTSPKWQAEAMNPSMKEDPNFSPYYANREVLYSARAGNPKIVEDRSKWGVEAGRHMVHGLHWYYDPQTKATMSLPETRSTNCNLPNIGSELWDR